MFQEVVKHSRKVGHMIILYNLVIYVCFPVDIKTSLQRRNVEKSDDFAKTTLLQRLFAKTTLFTTPQSLHETLQRRCFCNIFGRFHRNYVAASERHQLATRRNKFVTTSVRLLGSCNKVLLYTSSIKDMAQPY